MKFKRQIGCKNITVGQLIDELKSCDQDAIVCTFDSYNPDNGDTVDSSIELINEYTLKKYIDDNGDEQTGKIVSIL